MLKKKLIYIFTSFSIRQPTKQSAYKHSQILSKNMSSTMTTQMIVQKLAKLYNFDHDEAMGHLLTKKEIAADGVAKRKSERDAKKAKKDAKPKRADTGYILYCKSIRPDISEGRTAKEIISKCGEMWKALSQDTRDEWKTKANDLKTPEVSDDEAEPKKPKRALTGYQLYASNIRAELVAEMDGSTAREVMKAQGVRWKALEQTERDVWIIKAKDNAKVNV